MSHTTHNRLISFICIITINRFNLRNQIAHMSNNSVLLSILEKFVLPVKEYQQILVNDVVMGKLKI